MENKTIYTLVRRKVIYNHKAFSVKQGVVVNKKLDYEKEGVPYEFSRKQLESILGAKRFHEIRQGLDLDYIVNEKNELLDKIISNVRMIKPKDFIIGDGEKIFMTKIYDLIGNVDMWYQEYYVDPLIDKIYNAKGEVISSPYIKDKLTFFIRWENNLFSLQDSGRKIQPIVNYIVDKIKEKFDYQNGFIKVEFDELDKDRFLELFPIKEEEE